MIFKKTKWLFSIVLFFSLINTSFAFDLFKGNNNSMPLTESEAFRISNIESYNSNELKRVLIDVEDGYYLYKNKINLYSNGERASIKNIPYTIVHDDFYGEIKAVKNNFSIRIDKRYDHYLTFQGCSPQHNICYQPQYFFISYDNFENNFNFIPIDEKEFTKNTDTDKSKTKGMAIDKVNSDSSLIHRFENNSNAFIKILIFFIIGVGISFTPCVLPMIPIISSMIIKNADQEKVSPYTISLAYVLGSSTLYGVIGFITTLGFFGVQGYIQNTWFIIISSIILFCFALLMIDKINFHKIKGVSTINNYVNNKMNKIEFNFKNSFGIGFLSSMMLSPCVAAPLGVILLYTTTLTNPLISFVYLFSFGFGAGLILIFAGNLIKKINPSKFVIIKYLISLLILLISVFLLSRIISSSITVWVLYSFSFFYIAYLYLDDFNKNKARNLILPLFMISVFLILSSTEQNEGGYSTRDINYIESIDNIPESDEFLIKVYADWCIYCQDMEENIFNETIEGFEVYTLDITSMNNRKREVLQEYNAISAPAIILFKDGEHIETHNGFLNKKEFENLLYN